MQIYKNIQEYILFIMNELVLPVYLFLFPASGPSIMKIAPISKEENLPKIKT